MTHGIPWLSARSLIALALAALLVPGALVAAWWAPADGPAEPLGELPEETRIWAATATDPQFVAATIAEHAWKLPASFDARLSLAGEDGALRVIGSLTARDGASEEFLFANTDAVRVLGSSKHFIAVARPDQVAALLESADVAFLEPDVPVSFMSGGGTARSHVRSIDAAGTGIWSYDGDADSLVSDLPDGARVTGKGVTVAVLDSGIDRTHPDFFEWGCTPPDEAGMIMGGGADCPSRIKLAMQMAHVLEAYDGPVATAGVESGLATTDTGYGHGTHVAGIVAGNGHASRQEATTATGSPDGLVFGAAPEADLISIGIGETDTSGFRPFSDIRNGVSAWKGTAVAGMQWVLENAAEHDIRIVVNAWGCSFPYPNNNNVRTCDEPHDSVLSQLVEDLYDHGIVVFFPIGGSSLGNPGDLYTSEIATHPKAVAVQAYNDANDKLYRTANMGQSEPDLVADRDAWTPEQEGWQLRPDVSAPGVEIWSAANLGGSVSNSGLGGVNSYLETQAPRTARMGDGAYAQKSGTSMATAHAAGVAALLLEACPSAPPEEIVRALIVEAWDLAGHEDFFTPMDPGNAGYGAIDARASLDWLRGRLACQVSAPPTVGALSVMTTSMPGQGGYAFQVSGRDVDGDDDAIEWHWDLGDGSTQDAAGAASQVTHAYAAPGLYTVRVTATDEAGARDMRVASVSVSDPLPPLEKAPGPIVIRGAADLLPYATEPGGDEYIIEDLEIVLNATAASNARAKHGTAQYEPVGPVFYDPDAPNGLLLAPSSQLSGLQVDDTGGEDVLVRNLYIHTDGTLPPDLFDNIAGIRLEQAVQGHVTIEDVVVCGTREAPLDHGIQLIGAAQNTIRDILVCNARRGVDLRDAEENTLEGCHLFDNDEALVLREPASDGNTVHGCILHRNGAGIRITDPDAADNVVYDNHFLHNDEHAVLATGARAANQWNLASPQAGTNVIGAQGLCGNRWDDYPGNDADGDGLGDAPHRGDACPLFVEGSQTQADFSFLQDSHDGPTLHPFAGEGPVAVTELATSADESVVQYWIWRRGDGAYLNTTDHAHGGFLHEYAPGDYILNLTVIDSQGTRSSKEHAFHVDTRPSVGFSYDVGGLILDLDARCGAGFGSVVDPAHPCSTDADGDALDYQWTITGVPGTYTPGFDGTSARTRYLFEGAGTATVSLQVHDGAQPHGHPGGTNSTSVEITLEELTDQPPIADFSFELPAGATTATPIPFTDNSDDLDGFITSWSWDFGDGTYHNATSASERHPPPHQFPDEGTFGVRLTVADNDGFTDTTTPRLVTVENEPPSASFTIEAMPDPRFPHDDGLLYAADTLRFHDTSVDTDGSIGAWEWDFGDGATAAAKTPTHQYAEDGTYLVSLRVRDEDLGLSEWATVPIEVLNTPPVMQFTWEDPSPEDAVTTLDELLFRTDGTQDLDLSGDLDQTSWSWDFGDGNTTESPRPRHQYGAQGEYEVTLSVRDNKGAESSLTKSIVVGNALPTGDIVFEPRLPTLVSQVRFRADVEDPDGSIQSYSWDLGDGTTAEGPTVSHTYSELGTYLATLSVVDNDQATVTFERLVAVVAKAPESRFHWSSTASVSPTTSDTFRFFDESSDEDGSVVAWSWDFGDGTVWETTSIEEKDPPPHQYAKAGEYKVRLTVTDDQGKTGTSSTRVSVENVAAAIDFSFTPEEPVAGEPVAFRANATDPDGSVISYHWDFGDGTRSALAEPTHVFARKGLYTVRLEVIDDDGAASEATKAVSLANVEPTAEVGFAPPHPTTSEEVRFEAVGQDRDGEVSAYMWDFGDGTTAQGPTPVHRFSRPGPFNVTVKVVDDDGGVAEWTEGIVVANTPPAAAFTFSPPLPHTGDTIIFASSATDTDGSIQNWRWDMGDGSPVKTVRNPTHSYPDPGPRTIRLTVMDDRGDAHTSAHTLHIANRGPAPAFAHRLDADLPPGAVRFQDRSTDRDGELKEWAWDFGDGNTSFDPEPVHRYATLGAFVVTLTVTDDMGSAATTHQTVVIETAAGRSLHAAAEPNDARGAPALPATIVMVTAAGLAAARRWRLW